MTSNISSLTSNLSGSWQVGTTKHTKQAGGCEGGGGADEPKDILDLSSNLLSKLDTDGDGSIDLATEGTYGPDGKKGGGASAMLKLADTDGDGKVTQGELQAQLTSFDTDGDGAVSRTEMAAAFQKAGISMGHHHGGPPPPPPADDDSDDDSSVTGTSSIDVKALLQQMQDKLTSLDTDGDGTISASEIAAAKQSSQSGDSTSSSSGFPGNLLADLQRLMQTS